MRGARPVHPRALRDGLAADLRRHRATAAGHRAGRRVPGAVPVRLGDRRARSSARWSSSASSSPSRGASTAAPSAWWRPPGEAFRARFNVAIRTVTVDRTTGTAEYGTGGGITWDSDPAAEHAELLAKAAILAEPYEDFCLLETMAHVAGRGPAQPRPAPRPAGRLRGVLRLPLRPRGGGRAAGRRAEPDAGPGAAAAAPVRVALDVDVGPLPRRRPTARCGSRSTPSRWTPTQVWLRHKTTRRGAYTERAARHPDADDVVLVNERGQVTETTIANLAVRLDGRWWTPPLSAGCLPGVERGRLLDAGELQERALTLRTSPRRRARRRQLAARLAPRRPDEDAVS